MSTVFYTLAVLACPVSMGLMMYMMMRGQQGGSDTPAAGAVDPGEVDALRAQIAALEAERTATADRPPR